jgi:hypothetical protein
LGKLEAEVNPGPTPTLYPWQTMKADLGVNSTQSTGLGIKVGIMDGGLPYYNILQFQIGGWYDQNMHYNDHTTYVTSILGGSTGIAQGVEFFFTPAAINTNYISSYINWLISDKLLISQQIHYMFLAKNP